ncbi:hypothetical protein [Kordiimonas marina]|uniref:hypothetical protein n=1 Tax=Kordiimonas marina TaxID=2872312 RepID=UPI001FF41317|nr:hypothetical protein [Kordiimonas marina]MCJ9430027.1 hypothetical protein [Kordiimonas marina]
MLADVAKIVELLGGEGALGRRVRSPYDLVQLELAGIPFAAFQAFFDTIVASRPPISRAEIKRTIFSGSRPNSQGLMGRKASARLLRLANLQAMATVAIGTKKGMEEFLFCPHKELDGRIPFVLSKSELGGWQTDVIIARAEHGLPV